MRQHGDDRILVVANLSDSVQPVALDVRVKLDADEVIEIADEVAFSACASSPCVLTLAPYATFWLEAVAQEQAISMSR